MPDPLLDVQLLRSQPGGRAPTITTGLNFDGQPFSGSTPPDTVGDVGPLQIWEMDVDFVTPANTTVTELPSIR